MKTRKKILTAVFAVFAVCLIAFLIIRSEYEPTTQYGFACGSEVRVTAFGIRGGEKAVKAALDEIVFIDDTLISDTKSTSAVYTLNKNGVYIDESYKLTAYINECNKITEDCPQMTLLSGAFSKAWDIGGDGRIPAAEEISETVKKADMNNLTVDGNKITLKNSATLSFGAFGKGTVCEAGVNKLKENNVKGGIVTVGGTVGVFGKNDKSDMFTVGVRDPFGNANDYFATVNVKDAFLSTSGDYEKYFEKDGKRYCHIFNGKTGMPVESDITSVTVICSGNNASGTLSDALSTAIFILGDDDGLSLAEKYGAEVIIVKKDKTVTVSEGLYKSFTLINSEFKVTVK